MEINDIKLSSFSQQLCSLSFHDSVLKSVSFDFSKHPRKKSCKILMSYFNWDKEKSYDFEFFFGDIACFEYNVPDLLNRSKDIYSIDFNINLDKIYNFTNYKAFLNDANSKDGILSLSINLTNCSLEGDTGSLFIIGSEVKVISSDT